MTTTGTTTGERARLACVKVGVFGSRRALRPPSQWCEKGLHLITGHNIMQKRRGGPTRCRGCVNLVKLRLEWAELLERRTRHRD